MNYNQEDAQFMADWHNLANQLNSGIVSKEIKTAFEKADNIRIQIHQKEFSPESKWDAGFNKKHKLIIKVKQ